MSADVLYLSREDVAALAPPMADVIAVVDEGFRLRGRGLVEMPPKPSLHGEGGAFSQVMAAHVRVADALGVKWISLVPANAERGLPLAHALLVLNDVETGRPTAIMEAGLITAWRTGAAVAVAAKYLARPDVDCASVLGCGVQARAAVEALTLVLPRLRRVACFDRVPPAMERFAADVYRFAPQLAVEKCAAAADIAVGAGVVVSAITMGEQSAPPLGAGLLETGALAVALDYDTAWTAAAMAECERFVCDDLPQLTATKAAGQRLQTIPDEVSCDLAALAAGAAPGRQRSDERIFCMNLGVAVEDVMTAKLVYARALAAAVGHRLPL